MHTLAEVNIASRSVDSIQIIRYHAALADRRVILTNRLGKPAHPRIEGVAAIISVTRWRIPKSNLFDRQAFHAW
ncbi:MAG: hypothetical protein ACRDTE_08630 [Pseudonocardiaceae bacterium]